MTAGAPRSEHHLHEQSPVVSHTLTRQAPTTANKATLPANLKLIGTLSSRTLNITGV
jgi:hypothetical protein